MPKQRTPSRTVPESEPAGDYLTPEGHYQEASRLLWVIDDMLQDENVPRSITDLAVIALGHAITSLAAAEFEKP